VRVSIGKGGVASTRRRSPIGRSEGGADGPWPYGVNARGPWSHPPTGRSQVTIRDIRQVATDDVLAHRNASNSPVPQEGSASAFSEIV